MVVRTIVGTGVEAGSAEPPNGVLAQGIELYEPMDVDVSAYCRYVVSLNTDSHLVQMIDMAHPAGVYDHDIYVNGTKIHSAGEAYPAGPWLTTIAGEYVAGSAGAYVEPADHDPMKARFNNPQGIVINSNADTIYVADTENNVIRKIYKNSDGVWQIERFAGSSNATAGYGGDGGPALDALLNNPVGISFDTSEQNLYIADMNNQRIRKIDLTTNIITTVAGNGVIPPNQFTDVNDGTTAELGAPLNQVALFNYPSDVSLDTNGNIYVADQTNNRIRKIKADLSEIETIYGDGTSNLVNAPRGGVEVNWAGEVFVSDTLGARILKLTPEGLTPENYPPAPPCRESPNGTSVELGSTKQAIGLALTDSQFNFGVFNASGVEVATGTNDANGNILFSPIQFNEVGTYNYTIRETSIGGNGWEVDTNSYPVQVVVTDNGTGTLEAKIIYQDGVMPTFIDSYNPNGTEVFFYALKSAQGAELSNSQFSFGVFDTANVEVASGTNYINGNISFSPIQFNQPRTYNYTIRETSIDGNSWAVDTNSYPVQIVVTDNGSGVLETTIYYPNASIPTFINTYNTNGIEVTLEANKTAVGNTLTAGQFTFGVFNSSGTEVATGTNDVNGNILFSPLQFNEAGTYNYTIRETSIDGNGWAVDTNSYPVQIVVTDNGLGVLEATIYYPNGSIPTFINTYNANGIEVTLEASKTAVGNTITAGQFTFSIFDSSGIEVATGINDENGNILFSPLQFNEAGTYNYTIREASTDGNDWTVDKNSYQVQIVVTTNSSGNLEATVYYKNGSIPVFVNRYSSKPCCCFTCRCRRNCNIYICLGHCNVCICRRHCHNCGNRHNR